MQITKLAGWGIGISVLASAFYLPFWSLTPGGGAPMQTLYSTIRFTVGDLPGVLLTGIPGVVLLAAFILGGSMLVMLSGVSGVRPKTGGSLGVVGMALLIVGPIILAPTFVVFTSTFGLGFWGILLLSVVNLLLGLGSGIFSKGREAVGSVPEPSDPVVLGTEGGSPREPST